MQTNQVGWIWSTSHNSGLQNQKTEHERIMVLPFLSSIQNTSFSLLIHYREIGYPLHYISSSCSQGVWILEVYKLEQSPTATLEFEGHGFLSYGTEGMVPSWVTRWRRRGQNTERRKPEPGTLQEKEGVEITPISCQEADKWNFGGYRLGLLTPW